MPSIQQVYSRYTGLYTGRGYTGVYRQTRHPHHIKSWGIQGVYSTKGIQGVYSPYTWHSTVCIQVGYTGWLPALWVPTCHLCRKRATHVTHTCPVPNLDTCHVCIHMWHVCHIWKWRPHKFPRAAAAPTDFPPAPTMTFYL